MADDDARILALPQAPEAVELRHLRAFVAVAEELNFGRAAERLYVSQPALSRQIRALERGLGCELLRRSTHRVELTLAGDALLERARRVLADVDEAVSATQAVGGELSNRVARLFAPLAEVAAADADLEAMRAAYEELCARFEPPPEVATRSVIAGGVPALAARAGARRAGDAAAPARRRVHDGLGVRVAPARRRVRRRRGDGRRSCRSTGSRPSTPSRPRSRTSCARTCGCSTGGRRPSTSPSRATRPGAASSSRCC